MAITWQQIDDLYSLPLLPPSSGALAHVHREMKALEDYTLATLRGREFPPGMPQHMIKAFIREETECFCSGVIFGMMIAEEYGSQPWVSRLIEAKRRYRDIGED